MCHRYCAKQQRVVVSLNQSLADSKRVCAVEQLTGSQLLARPSQRLCRPMTANLSNWQMVSLGLKADEEGKAGVAVCSECVTQPREPPRARDETNSTRQDASRD